MFINCLGKCILVCIEIFFLEKYHPSFFKPEGLMDATIYFLKYITITVVVCCATFKMLECNQYDHNGGKVTVILVC